MSRNIEIKARLTDSTEVRQRLESLGASGPEELLQTDTFFVVSHGRLKLREFGGGAGELIFYERPDVSGPKLSEYIRVSVQEPDALRAELARALGVRMVVRKHRSVFLLGQTRIHLDDVEGLGAFVEFEVVLSDSQLAADGECIVASLMNALAIVSTDLVPFAYVDLLESVQQN